MQRREFNQGLTATALLLGAGPMTNALAQGAQPALLESQHYRRLSQAIPTTPGKVELIEFFWYGCPACYAFEEPLEAWAKQLPADVAYRKVHIGGRELTKVHQRLFFALEALGQEAALRPQIFNAIQRQRMMLDSVDAVTALIGKLGVDAARFKSAYDSFGVNSKCQQADQLIERYRIEGVPTVAIGGRFITSPAMVNSDFKGSQTEGMQRTLWAIGQLIQKARQA